MESAIKMAGTKITFEANGSQFKVNGSSVTLQLSADLLTHKINLNQLRNIAFDKNGISVTLETHQQDLLEKDDK